jgi:hypothetical protein
MVKKKAAAAPPEVSIPDASTRAGSTAKGAGAQSASQQDAPPPSGAGGTVILVPQPDGSVNEITVAV